MKKKTTTVKVKRKIGRPKRKVDTEVKPKTKREIILKEDGASKITVTVTPDMFLDFLAWRYSL